MLVEGGGVVSPPPSSWDLKWFLQLLFSALFVAVGLHTLLKNTASKYFEVHATFDGDQHRHRHNNNNNDSNASRPEAMPGVLAAADDPFCAECGAHATKKCSRCKSVRYCSQECQHAHWKSGHKDKCKVNSTSNGATNGMLKPVPAGGRSSSSIALIPSSGSGARTSRPTKQLKDVLFPYDEFVKFFNWDKPGFLPCGLLNCGNSCFANVVLQCLSFTRPLVAYLLEKGHRRECSSCNDWCFLCEFEVHVERTRLSSQAFSPTSILSRLSNIGGTLGYGRQEDAHEFMRFSIDAMQSACLDEFGGEKAVPPKLQETTLIQHIFGGRLQSEVICTKCEKISNQYENMMDLTVEIHGDAVSLEECLDQFTVKEWLHGENMYRCDGCKDYVKAWKRLTVKHAPNILTIALKRFQSGRFGKLNKRVAFPETLNLSPYMSEAGDGSNIYKLYAVVVHIDMLNASYFGHYICYIKDFRGSWYRIDDWKVTRMDLEEVLSQGAYMLLYSRSSARPSGLQIQTTKSSGTAEVKTVEVEVERSPNEEVEVERSPNEEEAEECLSNNEAQAVTHTTVCEVPPSVISSELKVSIHEHESSTGTNPAAESECSEDTDMIDVEPAGVTNEISSSAVESSYTPIPQTEPKDDTITDMDWSGNNFAISSHCQNVEGDSEHNEDVVKCKLETAKDNAEDGSFHTETDQGNGINKVEIIPGVTS